MQTVRLGFETFPDQVLDLTRELEQRAASCPGHQGQILVFVPGSGGSVCLLETGADSSMDPSTLRARLLADTSQIHRPGAPVRLDSSPVLSGTHSSFFCLPFFQNHLMLDSGQRLVFLEFRRDPRPRALIIQVIYEVPEEGIHFPS